MSNCTLEGLSSTKANRLDGLNNNDIHDHESYNTETETEKKCHDRVNAFKSDFIRSSPHLRDRLFLQPKNEASVKKFVTTFIKPTLLPYQEFYDLESCAIFLSRYISYEPLVDAPAIDDITVVSPAQTLDWATGDCFDCSFLMASILIGAGYDAYVVVGKAPEWIRLKDQRHQTCTLKPRDCDDDISKPWSVEVCIKDESYPQQHSQNINVHCWVLVKAGKRDINESCFVEPSTGILYPISGAPYSEVFSVCNDQNCWVNIGESSLNVEEELELGNTDQWMPVVLDDSAPYSWVNTLELPKEKYDFRYPPDGKRTINLNKAKLSFFGIGLVTLKNIDPQGVICRVLEYDDNAQTIVVQCTELFEMSRDDNMIQRTRRPLENEVVEYFSHASDMTERKILPGQLIVHFDEKARADGLVLTSRRTRAGDEIGSSITEHFLNREDGLQKREVFLSPQSKDAKKPKMCELLPMGNGKTAAVIERIVDEYLQAPANESNLKMAVSRRTFALKDREIRVTYHSEHEVLQKEEVFCKDTTAKEDPLLQLENTSIAAVKNTQKYLLQMNESKYLSEVKKVGSHTEFSSAQPSSAREIKSEGVPHNIEVDYLSPYLGTETLSYQEATRVKNEALKYCKERLMDRANIIQTKLDNERQRLVETAEDAEADVKFNIELLQTRLKEHEERSILKHQELEKKLAEDLRLASLHDVE